MEAEIKEAAEKTTRIQGRQQKNRRRIAKVRQEVVWEPIPDSSQELALDSRAQHTLFHGTRGPGKTTTQLMRFRRYVGIGYGTHWCGIIFDQRYKDLKEVVKRSKELFKLFDDGARFYDSPAKYMWTWPTGEQLYFRHIDNLDDCDGFLGHEYAFIGWNELTKWESDEIYLKILSVNRAGFVPEEHTPRDNQGNYITEDGEPLPEIPLQVFSTTNPSGPGHSWVRERFITPATTGEIVERPFHVYNPRTKQKETIVKKQVAIFGTYHENPYLPGEYIASLEETCKKDPRLKRAWLYGDWDITTGGAIDDLWNKDIHVIPRSKIPEEWTVDRAFDWGCREPFSVGWWAVANGEEMVLSNGETFCPPRGTLIQIGEWYGGQNLIQNKGLRMSAVEVSWGILTREKEMVDKGWIKSKPFPGPADNSIGSVINPDSDTIACLMAEAGVNWEKCDKSSGSLIIGLQLLRDRLWAALNGEGPAIYFMDNCVASITQLPTLPMSLTKPGQVHEKAIDHVYDMVRYRVLHKHKEWATDLEVGFVL